MGIVHFWVFALASLVLNITPGNDMLYIISRSAGQGVKAGIVSALGVMAGCTVHILAAVAGLSALIAGSATAFDVIKYMGAAYLVYLGVRSLINRKRSLIRVSGKQESISYRRIFTQGVITNVLNPKVALFFLAFLPPFIDAHAAHPGRQILVLGIWFDCSGTMVNILVAVLFGKMGNWLAQSPRFLKWQEKVTGLVLIGLGIKVAMGGRK